MKPAAMSPDTVYRGGIKKCLRIGVSDVISETDKFLCGTDAGDFRKFWNTRPESSAKLPLCSTDGE